MARTPFTPNRTSTRSAQQGSFSVLDTLAQSAVQLHQRGQLAEAERLYRQILAIDPHHANSLHLLGALAHQLGRDEMAIELIGKAIASDSRQASYHCNLGTALQAQGRHDEAAASYLRALALKPDLAEAHMNLGAVLELLGKRKEAESRFRRALAIKPTLAEAHMNLGNVLLEQGKVDEAAASQERALELKPEFAEACFNLGNVRHRQGRLVEAIANYRRSLALKPDAAEVYGNLGNALLAKDNPAEAVACYERALTLKPDFAEACYNMGNAQQAQNKLIEAVACYERALQLKPLLPEAHYNLGNTLHTLDRLDEAQSCFELALALRPDYSEAHYNLGCVLQDLGRLDEARSRMRRALEIKPGYSQARFALALTELKSGNLATGWRAYESRWQSQDHDTPARNYPQPLWTDEKLAQGRVLLWGEQGVGDEIQFAGLIPEALATGNQFVLDCDPRLRPLFVRSFPQVEVLSSPEPPEIQAQLPTGSLPSLFRTSAASFSAGVSPYLKADPLEQVRFRTLYSDGRRLVGLAWHTNSPRTGRKRSISLAQLAPLFAQAGVRWISLQYGDFDALEAQAQAADAPLLIDRQVDQMADIDLFAAQVAAMRRVITIDNSTAHLAGALGVPVWLLLPFAADWRWQEQRTDSPWYPSLRLFRQPRLGDWQSVIEQVAAALADEISSLQTF
jgi:tetratricopeptide (TPR) repeat protein